MLIMKLLLTSAGLTTDSLKSKFFELVGKDPKDVTIVFIPTAANPEMDKSYIQFDLDNLLATGISKIEKVDIATQPLSEVIENIQTSDVVWIAGGNTFYLLDQLRKTGLDKSLQELVKDKVYVGVSAGSIVVTPTIEIANVEPADENNVGLTDLAGLGWVDFEISPHTPGYMEPEKIKQYAMSRQNKVYSLDDLSGICVVNNQIEFI